VPINARPWGVISILPRPDDIPFLSEDAELLRMLGRTLGSVMDSQRLRDQRLRQEQREQELVLSAARSELKALRAQINPHFLFNALNTIAALISKNPGRAEQTVEQLAEVFRYALRRSAREWVPLAEEIDFVRSYLQIEQTRFGERLKVLIELEDGLENFRIPAMVIQTLAENAVKHGITAIRGLGLITVSAHLTRNGGIARRVLIRVGDNGPGFPEEFCFDWLAKRSAGGGHGLTNIQRRLIAHYGGDTTLQFERDAVNSATVVSFEIPAVAYVTGSD
jgi:LytS/YehU family sensor histidine kinase